MTDASLDQPDGTEAVSDDVEDEKVPKMFVFTIVMAIGYVSWRLIQLGARLVDWMF